ncbi:multifunctional CCA addition/repair protein [Reinekea blandensis]|uniref:Multifunctional CCA protein n=1 Tax=Reinekea blandensis MED297 TaxID=314283 RepID=A4BAI4_9GAMM|nr:multifunctional CCA addition/repair protein [Reinekea blandensis]EAR10940.1 tRNA nucleotidyl transferase [Reinekea sp. MED297] [Reinekea blandensis MED297]
MNIYLVGGAVRDQYLNLPVKDRDWVVVGARPQQLLDLGYKQVGADFPVFLHPQTHEEYALARTERKSGHGYSGFNVHFDPDVTLEDDLARRDLTINAMAQAENGELFDPYQGLQDLEQKKLRHVTEAFREDPLRVLRVARFAARYDHLGFTVADETLQLMHSMVTSGELAYLTPERVWTELSKALTEATPSTFFNILRQCGALKVVFPELDRLFGVPQPMRWHPEIDTGIHVLKALDTARKQTNQVATLFASLCHDLGKGLTPSAHWPSHRGHESLGADLIPGLAKKYRWPKQVADLTEKVARYHTHCHRIDELKPSTIVKLLGDLNAFRQPETVENFVLACQADARGRSGFEQTDYPQGDVLKACLEACIDVTAQPFIDDGLTGKAIGEAMNSARVQAVANIVRPSTPPRG